MSSWQVILFEPARVLLIQIGEFLGKLIAMLLVLLVGWWISRLIKGLVTRVLRFIKIDDISSSAGIDSFLAKGGLTYSLSELIGVVSYWLALLVTFMVALTTFNLITPGLLDRIVSYVPNVIAAIFILILGMFVATVLKTIVHTAATNAGIAHVNVLGKLVEIVIIVFASAIALEQLNIGARIIQMLVSIVLGSIGLAIGLAFGLGCKDIAAKHTAEFLDKIKAKK